MKSPINDSVITCDEITDAVTKSNNDTSETVTIISNHKTATCKMGYYILHTILLVIILFLEILITCY